MGEKKKLQNINFISEYNCVVLKVFNIEWITNYTYIYIYRVFVYHIFTLLMSMFNAAILPHNIKKIEYSRFYEDSKITNVKSKLAFPRPGLQVKPRRISGLTHIGDLTVKYAKSWGICMDAYVWGPI